MTQVGPGNRFSRRARRPHGPKAASEVKRRRNIKPVLAYVTIIILAGIPFALGKYFEFNSPDPFDSGLNVYSAKRILDGARIGVDEVPSADTGTLLVNIFGVWLFGFSETGPKLIQMLSQAGALVLMFIALRKLFGGILPAAVGVVVTSVYISAPMIAKFGNVKEQFMIACTAMGISCLVLRQLGGKWWLAVLAGAFVSWAPLFKPIGMSAVGAVGLFVIAQPLLKHRTFRQTAADILLLVAGAAAAIGPIYVWIIGWHVQTGLPYSFAWQILGGMVGKVLAMAGGAGPAKPAPDYVSESRKLVPFSEHWPRVLRYYLVLILPISLALSSIIVRVGRMVHRVVSKSGPDARAGYDRFVLLLAVWWILDMAFVWVSAMSYEQYYLPLNASAAVLGGYAVAVYRDRTKNAVNKGPWVMAGLVGLALMVAMSWHIFFGVQKSPHTGSPYTNPDTGELVKRRGYAQKLQELSLYRRNKVSYPWEEISDYIRLHSNPNDKMYVWGWYPGMYLRAQRLSASSKPVMMPRPAPQQLADAIAKLLAEFKREMPKFIVDSRKPDIPTDRPPYELWPIWPRGFMGADKDKFLPLDKNVIAEYDKLWSEMLRTRFDEDEALRYETLKPFRDFVMQNYRIVRTFGTHVLFQLKEPTVQKGPQ